MKTYGSECKTCHGTGYIVRQVTESEVYENPSLVPVAFSCPDCNGGLDARARRNRELSGIPEIFDDAYLDSFRWDAYETDTGKQEKIISSFVEDFNKWRREGMGLYIFSKTRGAGKTRLACSIMNELVSTYGLRGKFIVVSDILDRIKQADLNKKDNPLNVLMDTDILIADDIGSKSGNEWLNDTLFRLLDARMNRRKVTIFTSNVKLEELKLDDRVVDRINRASLQFPIPEVSVRARQAKEHKKEFLRMMGIA